MHIGGRVAEAAASRLGVAFEQAAGLSPHLVAPDLEFSHGSRVDRAVPRFRVSPPIEKSENLDEAFRLASESTDDFERRQEGARMQFANFKQALSSVQAHLVLVGISIPEMKALLEAHPSLLEEWAHLILHHPAANLNAIHNIGVTLAGAIGEEDSALARCLLQRLSGASPYVRHVCLGRQVELQSYTIWNTPLDADLQSMQGARLDACANDNDIATEVLAAVDAGRADTLERYVKDRLDSGLPSRMARALTIVGFSLPSAFNETTLQLYAQYHGMVGVAARAARGAHERQGWAEHWYEGMRKAEDPENLWRAAQLFRECVDARFEVVRKKAPVGSELYELYKESVFADLHNLYDKRANDRKKTLFGAKAPSADFLPESH